MKYEIRQVYCRPWLLNSLSFKLIESHYEHIYGGALRKLNSITEQLEALDFAKAPANVVNGLKREELVALNSLLLHELYFASLGGEGKPTKEMAEVLAKDFGSVDRWRDEFMAMGRALAGDSGWVVLSYLPRDRRLINQYASEHTQSIAGGIPILALDMFEHAYHLDYGTNAAAYVDAFMRNIDWTAVATRYEDATRVEPPRAVQQPEFGDLQSVSVEAVKAMIDSGEPVQIIDTRPRHAVSRDRDIAKGVTWRDPDRVHEWMGELSKSEPVITYCVYGFHVGCKTAIALRQAGFDAKYMAGGHSGWRAAGYPVVPKGE